MRTREVIEWHETVSDLVELAVLSAAGALLVGLTNVCDALEAWIDARAEATSGEVCVWREEGAGPSTTSAKTGAGESQGPRGFSEQNAPGWRIR